MVDGGWLMPSAQAHTPVTNIYAANSFLWESQVVVKVSILGVPVECLFCHRASGILLSDDLLFYGDDDSYK